MKIAICSPHYGDVHPLWMKSVLKMVVRTVQTPINFNGSPATPEIELFMKSSSTLPTLRNQLFKDALDWGAHYLLWADSDHTFPETALLHLLTRGLDVVGVNYGRRTFPTYPTTVGMDGGLVWTDEDMAKAREVTQVRSMGLGLCLMDMSIVPRLEAQAAAEGRSNIWPLFAYEIRAGEIEGIGEDVFFFRRLSEAGISLHVDHALSWSIGHAHQKLITNFDTLRERDAYLQKCAEISQPPSSAA